MRTPEARPAEIGGYFGFAAHEGSLFHDDAIRLNSGRNALVYLLESRAIRRLWLPDYLCDSVAVAARAHGTELRTYSVDRHLQAHVPADVGDEDWIYVVNYLGQLSTTTVTELRQWHPRIIVDNAQAFFTPPASGIDTIYTCRKFFGVADGALLATDTSLDRELHRGTSAEFMAHVLGRSENSASEHYAQYRASEQRLVGLPLQQMSTLTESILRSIDYSRVRAARELNFAVLAGVLDDLNELDPTMPAGPFAYPLLHPLGAQIRPRLHASRIYVPQLWPNVLSDDGAGDDSRYLTENLIPLPIDQRYTRADMTYLAGVVKEMLDGTR